MARYGEFNNQNTETKKIVRGILLGCTVGIVVSNALLSLLAILFVKLGSIPLDYLPLITTFTGAIGAFTAGYSTVKLYRKRGMLMGALAGFLMFLIVLITGISKGIDNDLVSIIIKCAVFVVIGSIGGIIRVNKKQKVKNYH